MSGKRNLLHDSLRTGAVAGVATSVTAALCGEIEDRNAIAPLNAISHIAWGEEAARAEKPSWKYTATGLGLNLAANATWAAIYEWAFGRRGRKPDVVLALIGGAVVSALAYVTDYHVVPARLTPGFEKRLSNRSLLGIYSVLALSLACGSLCRGGENPGRG